MILLLAAAFLLEPKFFTGDNLANVLNQLAIPGTLALGMTFIILTGGIDLSVGSLFALLNCILATWCKSNTPLGLTIPYVLLIGTLIGALVGWIVSMTRLQAFVVTLAGMVTFRGIAYVYSDGAFISIRQKGEPHPIEAFQHPALGLPISAWLLLGATGAAWLILAKTSFGRRVYAIGGNEEASRLSGVPVSSTRIAAFAINGFCVALAAILATARTANGQFSLGIGYELDAIAGAVVGGCSLLGGYGSVIGTFGGALFIMCIDVLMVLKGINVEVAKGFKGIIILVAVYIQNLGRR